MKASLRTTLAAAAALVASCGSGKAAAQTPTVAGHPRLLVTPATVTALKARMSDPDLADVISSADSLAAMGSLDPGYEGNGYSDAAPTLGLAYLVTGDMKYAKPLLDMLDTLNAAAASGDVSAVSVDSTYASRSTAFAVAIAFDWAYPALGDARKAATVKTVNAYYDWFLNGDRVADRDGPATSNYFVGHLLGFGSMGYATDGDNSRAQEIIAKIKGLYDANIPDSFTTGANAGGFPVEGYVYGANTFVRLFQYIQLVQTATGQAIGQPGQWADDIVRSEIAALKPNLWQLSDEGEYTADDVGFIEPNQLQTFASLADDPQVRSYGSWLIANRGQAPMGTNISLGSMTKVLFPIADAPVDYRGSLRTYREAPGAAMMFMRSSWDGNAVWASFNASFKWWTGHTGRQTGHFTIQRGSDDLLVNGGQWKLTKVMSGSTTTGYTGPGYTGNTYVMPSSGWTNTLFADDGAGGYLLDGDEYYGGQGGFSDNQPFLVSQRADSTYVKVDATHAYQDNHYPDGYDQRAVTTFVRNYAFFAPGNFVTFDRVRVKSTAVTYNLRFYFNSNAPPTISNGVATSTVGGSRLFMHPVLPANANMQVAWQQLENVNFVPRVELRPASASTSFDALTVFTAAGTEFTSMPATVALQTEDGSMVGVQIREPQLERVAMFANDPTGTVSGPIAYTVTSTGARHSVFDLPPNAGYTVTAAASGGDVRIAVNPGGSALMTDAAGVLAFDVAGTAVTALPVEPQPLVTEPPRTPPPPMAGSGGGASGGCGCMMGQGRQGQEGRQGRIAWSGAGLWLAAAALGARRRPRRERPDGRRLP